jgi:hypothetical protein
MGSLQAVQGRFADASALFHQQEAENAKVTQRTRSKLRGCHHANREWDDLDKADPYGYNEWQMSTVPRIHSVRGTEFLACSGLRSVLTSSPSATAHVMTLIPPAAGGQPDEDAMRGEAMTLGCLIDLMLAGADRIHCLELCWRRLTALHYVKENGSTAWPVAANMESKFVRLKRGENVDPGALRVAAGEAAIARTARANYTT